MCFKFSIVEKKGERVPDQLGAASQLFEPRSMGRRRLRGTDVGHSKPGDTPKPLTRRVPQRLANRVDISPADIGPTDASRVDIAPAVVEAPLVKATSVSALNLLVNTFLAHGALVRCWTLQNF